MLILLLRISPLVAIGFGLYVGNEFYKDAKAKSVVVRKTCPACRGQGKMQCATCGGFGSTEETVRAKCTQCNGTGTYAMKLKRGRTECPFCHGNGYKVEPRRVACSLCKSLGWVSCRTCGGTGVVLSAATHQ